MIEVRIHGRGGQGAVIASKMLAAAVFKEGRHVQSVPALGVEQRGTPVAAFARIDNKPVRIRCQIYHPDHAMVLDPSLMEVADVTSGLREDGWSRRVWQVAPDRGITFRSPRDQADLDGPGSASGFIRMTNDESGD